MNTKTNSKCTLCGKSTNHKTYYVALTKEGLVTVTRCASKDLTIIGQSKDKNEAREMVRLISPLLYTSPLL